MAAGLLALLLGQKPGNAEPQNRDESFTVYMPAEGVEATPPLVAVYYKDLGWVPRVSGPQVILAIWRDGRIVWSLDPIKGGPPYRTSRFAPQKLAGHADARTTRLYDRRQKKVTRNIVERISI